METRVGASPLAAFPWITGDTAMEEAGQFLLTGLGEAKEDVTTSYKAMAARVLRELETSLGRGLPETEQFMFVHGTAECRWGTPLHYGLIGGWVQNLKA